MQKYLDFLDSSAIDINEDYLYLINLLRKFVLGKISPYNLTHSVKDDDFFVFYVLINQLVRFNYRVVRYFIELPKDKNFQTNYPKGIFAANTISYGVNNIDLLELVGPSFMRIKTHLETFDSISYTEITGNFSSIPNGAMISTSDYFRIIIKYEELFNYMINGCTKKEDIFSDIIWEDRFADHESIESRINYIESRINYIEDMIKKDTNGLSNGYFPRENWYAYSSQITLPQDVIDSIEFVSHDEVISIEDLKASSYGSFKDLIGYKDDFIHPKILKFPRK